MRSNLRKKGRVWSFLAMAVILITAPAAVSQVLVAPSGGQSEARKLAREIFQELIEINTTHELGITQASEAMAKRLRDAGFPPEDIQVLDLRPDKRNLVATPVISTGASDGLFLRRAGIPVCGVSGMFGDIDDTRAHGRDERMGVAEFCEGVEFMYRLMKTLASGEKTL